MKATFNSKPTNSDERKPPQPVKATIGEWADYLVCDPDGIGTPDGLPKMEPSPTAWRMLRWLEELTERITGAPLEPTGPAGVVTISIRCPKCGRTSHHPEDVRQRYCGNCHQFHDEMK